MVDRIDPRPGETLFDPACGTGGFLTCALRHMRTRYVKRPGDERKMQAALRAVEKKQLPHMLRVTNMLLHGIESNFPQHFRTRETADLFLALIIRLLKPRGRTAMV